MTALPTRQQVRDAFASVLAASEVGDGKPVKAVYAYRIGDFNGQTPVRAIGSAGSEPRPLTLRGGVRAAYNLDVFTFVLYAALDDEEQLILDAQGQPVWDEQDAENMLDLLDAQLTELVAGLRANPPYWQAVSVGGASQVEVITLGGLPYYLEITPLRFDVY